jgi:hypothetical protein
LAIFAVPATLGLFKIEHPHRIFSRPAASNSWQVQSVRSVAPYQQHTWVLASAPANSSVPGFGTSR